MVTSNWITDEKAAKYSAKYSGEWIIVSEGKLLAHNQDLKKLKKKLSSLAKETKAVIFRIPEKDAIMVL